MNRLLAVVLVAACGGTEPSAQQPTPAPNGTVAQRPITPRAELPTAIAPLLPKNGIYVAGGGAVSTPWRIVVDLDAKTIYAGSSSTTSAPSFGPMEREATKELSARNGSHLMGLAHAAWNEAPPKAPLDATVDYDEILIVLEGDDTFFLQGYGPIKRPAAAKAIVEIRAAAGL